jgi:DNA polymerase-3 subunit epsilon
MQIDHATPLVFIDLETTGTSPRHSRIIEIGLVRVERGKVVCEYRTFVDPGELVPPFVTFLTGIESSMLVGAPAFDDVALEVAELLEDALFIAHNAPFDYGFLSTEFRRLGMAFSRPYLCTAKLSRALFPEQQHHNLDSIIARFNLDAGRRHRALDDARVLWQLTQVLERTYGTDLLHAFMQEQVHVRKLPPHISEDTIQKLPEEPGVYFFHGKDDELLYVGKSRKIRTRVRAHFAKDDLSGRGSEMLGEIRRISYQKTGGEIGAFLLESHITRNNPPLYTMHERPNRGLWLVKEFVHSAGYHTAVVSEVSTIEQGEEKDILALFGTEQEAIAMVEEAVRVHELCPHLLGIERTSPCLSYGENVCRGACIEKEKPRHYNKRFRAAFKGHQLAPWPYTGPVGIEERHVDGTGEMFILDNWRLLAALTYDGTEWSEFIPARFNFDLEVYTLFSRELFKKRSKLSVRPLTQHEQYLIRVDT